MKGKAILYTIICWFVTVLTANAQVDLSFSADSTEIEIGSPFSLTLTLRFDPETTFRNAFPDLQLPEDFDVEIMKAGDWDTMAIEPLVVLTRRWSLMAFDTGTLQLETLPLAYVYNLIPDRATAKPFPLKIFASDTEQSDLYPIKDLERIKVKSWTWLWVLGILMLGVVIFLLARYYYLKNKHRTPPPTEAPVIPQIRPIDKALQALEEMRPKIDSRLYPEELFYVELSKVIKEYLQARTHHRVTGWTSTETLDFFGRILTDHSRETLKALLNQSDLVKFAQANTEEEIRASAIHIAMAWLKKTDPTLWRESRTSSSEKDIS